MNIIQNSVERLKVWQVVKCAVKKKNGFICDAMLRLQHFFRSLNIVSRWGRIPLCSIGDKHGPARLKTEFLLRILHVIVCNEKIVISHLVGEPFISPK